MEFNRWYDFYFDNHGKCPFCGKQLVMHCGCANWECGLCQQTAKEDKWFAERAVKNTIRRHKEHLQLLDYYERKRKNLDKHEKKHYIEADNQGVSE